MVSDSFGTLIKSVQVLLTRRSQLSGIIHLAEHEEIVGLIVKF